MKENIGAKLKTLRKIKKMTQQDVANALGVKRSTISNYEIGRRSPSLSELRRMGEFYGGVSARRMHETHFDALKIYHEIVRAK